ncbi:MAG: alpha/beta hydrolase domain-containing protein [Pirellulales bacterium]
MPAPRLRAPWTVLPWTVSWRTSWVVAIIAIAVAASAARLSAEVTRWEINHREPYAGGKSIGEVGPYERWTGVVHYAIDPRSKPNRPIVDLDLAPTNAEGKVEFSADFELLVPVDRSKANGALFYEVNNRGNKTAPGIIDGGADDFLCRQGFVVLSSGWIAEVQPGGDKLRLNAPVPLADGKPIRGIVRNELVVDRPTEKASISHRGNQGSYRPAADKLHLATLTRREREADKREPIPADDWKLIVTDVEPGSAKSQLPLVELQVAGGLRPGRIYEVIYEAEGSLVQGTGLAAIRDIVSALKFGDTNAINPLLTDAGKPLVTRSLGFGTSQSGRCLRHFLWEGFNADEQGRKVFDGVISHVAGGGLGSFNHRFASPTRTNGQHDEHLFPADYFPFTYGDERDSHTDQTDGILAKCRRTNTVPKVFHTQSSSEYWHRSGSLVHTDPLGERDAEIPPEVRIYTFGGTQHGPGSGVPGAKGGGTLPSNPADYRPLMRALVVALDAWVRDGKQPPPSVYPRIDAGTLVPWQREASGFPDVPGVAYPLVIQQPPLLDRGPDWRRKRIAVFEPPKFVDAGASAQIIASYGVLVPAVGKDGNTRGTLNLPAISVPVATYTSWNLRDKSIGAEGELLSLQGGYIPLPRTKAEREANHDPRPSLEEHYKDYADYESKYLAAAAQLVSQRYMLAEDLPRLNEPCRKFEKLFNPPEPK